MDRTRLRVGFVGVGNMGAPMAINMARAGHAVAVFDAREDAALAVASTCGARLAHSLADVADGAEVVCVAVLDGPQVEAVCLGEGGVVAAMAPGAVLAVHSTVHPSTIHRVAEVAPPAVAVLDAPISGGVQGARDATLCIMVGGVVGAFGRAKPVFDAAGNLVVHLGALGSGLAAKLARNLVGYISLVAAYEGRMLGEYAGVDTAVLTAILEHTGGLSPVMRSMMAGPDGRDAHVPEVEALVALAEKDMRATLQLASDLGLDLPAAFVTAAEIGAALRRDRLRGSSSTATAKERA